MESLGWIINFQKSDLVPTQEIKLLGYKFDLRVGLVFPTEKKIHRLLEMTVSMLKASQTFPRKHGFNGDDNTIGSPTCEATPMVSEDTLEVSPVSGYPSTCVPSSQKSSSVVDHLSNLRRGSPLHQEHNLLLFTDASLKGWGAHLKHHTASGLWNQVDSRLHINILELKAVFQALKSFKNHLLNQNLLISTDNSSVVAYLNKQRGTHSQENMCPHLEDHGLGKCQGNPDLGKTHSRESQCSSRFSVKKRPGDSD